MNCIKHKPVGAGGCMKGSITQGSCQRVAKHTRLTSGGVRIRLCDKCDAAFGRIVGEKV